MAYCTNLALMSESVSLNPVALPPGCERLSTSPMAMGLPTLMNTMGIVDVRRLAATDALEPVGTNSSAPRRITSVTAWLGSPDSVQTISSTISRSRRGRFGANLTGTLRPARDHTNWMASRTVADRSLPAFWPAARVPQEDR